MDRRSLRLRLLGLLLCVPLATLPIALKAHFDYGPNIWAPRPAWLKFAAHSTFYLGFPLFGIGIVLIARGGKISAGWLIGGFFGGLVLFATFISWMLAHNE